MSARSRTLCVYRSLSITLICINPRISDALATYLCLVLKVILRLRLEDYRGLVLKVTKTDPSVGEVYFFTFI